MVLRTGFSYQKRNILFICLFLLLFQILRTQFFKLLLFIKFGRRLFFMKLCHSYLTFVIQLIFSHFVHLLFLSLKRIYSTNIIYLILLNANAFENFIQELLNKLIIKLVLFIFVYTLLFILKHYT